MGTGAVAKAKKRPDVDQPESEAADQVRIRVSPAFKEWLIRYADSRNLTMTDVIVQDLMRGAKAEGFEAPPKR